MELLIALILTLGLSGEPTTDPTKETADVQVVNAARVRVGSTTIEEE